MEKENNLQYVNNLPVKAGKIQEKIHSALSLLSVSSLNFYLYIARLAVSILLSEIFGKFPSSDLLNTISVQLLFYLKIFASAT